MRVWQCTKTDHHMMVRPVTRCTLCESIVEERALKEEVDNKKNERIAELELDMMFEPF